MPAKTQATTTLPIAFKSGERALLQAAAAQVGKAESTYVRQVALVAARAQLSTDPADQVPA